VKKEYFKFNSNGFYVCTATETSFGVRYSDWESFVPERVTSLKKEVVKHDIYCEIEDYLYIETLEEFEIVKDGKIHTFNQTTEYRIPCEQSPYGGYKNLASVIEHSYESRDGKNYVIEINIDENVDNISFALGKRNRGRFYSGVDFEKKCDIYEWRDVIDDIIPLTKIEWTNARFAFNKLVKDCNVSDDVKEWAYDMIDSISEQIQFYYSEMARLMRHNKYIEELWGKVIKIKDSIIDDDTHTVHAVHATYPSPIDRAKSIGKQIKKKYRK